LGEEAILWTEGLVKEFDGFRAVNGVSMKIERGTCKGLIGPNGAGKTTLFNLLTGFLKPTSGRIFFEGREITHLPPHERAKLGIGRSFQVTNIFQRLPVIENVRLAVQAMGRRAFDLFTHRDDLREYWERAIELLWEIGLADKLYVPAGSLTISDQRKLEVAMALAGEPKLLLLDEPTAGVSMEDVPDVLNVIESVRKRGDITILLVEHKIDVVMGLCDKVMVMHKGSIIMEGTPEEVAANETVQEIYLGGL